MRDYLSWLSVAMIRRHARGCRRRPGFQPRLERLEDRLALASISIGDSFGFESQASFAFAVTLSEVGTEPISVDYATADGTAKAGNDYRAARGTLRFEPGQTMATISIEVVDDRRYEGGYYGSESFSVNLTNAVGADIADGIGFGRIVDNDIEKSPGPPCRRCLMAEDSAADPAEETLNADLVQPLLGESFDRWHVAGIDAGVLGTIDVRVEDLGGVTLGLAAGNTIWLDDNGAGWGWFVDATPWEDAEFTTSGDQGEEGRMDLLSVLMHELGHLLGRDHDEEGVMAETLAADQRLSISATDHGDAVDQLFALSDDALSLDWLSGVDSPGRTTRRTHDTIPTKLSEFRE